MSSNSPPLSPLKPPYPPTTAQLGGTPAPIPDIPISAVLLALFACGFATHITFFVRNRRRNRPFFFSFLLGIFCVTRIAALSLRIAWARNLTDVNVAIAAGVFTAAGVLILYIVGLMLSVRVVRGVSPGLGWGKGVWWGVRVVVVTIVGCLVMVVTCAVHTVFTNDPDVREKERRVVLVAGVYMTCLAVLPAVVMGLLAAGVGKGKGGYAREDFGSGKMRTKMLLLVFTSLVLTLGAGFRCGVSFAVRPVTQPAWYHSRPPFYCFNFVIELLVVYTYAIMRFDRRFYVPVGSSKPGDYSAGREEAHDCGRKDGGSTAASTEKSADQGSGV